MKLFIAFFITLGLAGCAGFANKDVLSTKVDDRESLIQLASKDHIICYLDGNAVLGSANEKSVAPGQHVVVVTKRVCAEPITLRLNMAAGLIYQVSTDRLSVKVINNLGATVSELFLDPNGSGKLLTQVELQRVKELAEVQWRVRMQQQTAVANAEWKRKIDAQPQIRKIGAQICKRGNVQFGFESFKVIYVGNVEAITDEKVQIRVSRAYFENTPAATPGGFSPEIIWDDPMHWDVCR